jgi:hypothetical protein
VESSPVTVLRSRSPLTAVALDAQHVVLVRKVIFSLAGRVRA